MTSIARSGYSLTCLGSSIVHRRRFRLGAIRSWCLSTTEQG